MARAIPGPVLERWLLTDVKYVRATIGAGQELLAAFLKLLPSGELKYAPIRTFFRVINCTIILLKVRQELAFTASGLSPASTLIRLTEVIMLLLWTLRSRIKSRRVVVRPYSTNKLSLF